MKQSKLCAGFGASFLSVAVLSGCSGTRPAEHAAPPSSSPPPTAVVVPGPPEEPTENVAADTANEARPAETPSTETPSAELPSSPPACICAEPKAKPKTRHKAKPVRREAPPQLPTAPVVAATSAGGVVDAQVKPMGVPVMSILGKRVQGPRGEDLGRVVDVLADATGRVRIAIIDFGGFLGVGDRRIAVDWPLLRFSPDATDPSLLLSVSREKLKATPEYKDNPRPQTLMVPTPPPDPVPAQVPTTENKK